jgi:hypothetical protein
MSKIDLRRDLPYYSASARNVAVVDVPEMRFLMIDGRGDPNTESTYQQAVEALYAVAYGCKFAVKKGTGVDYAVMPLEGLWWTEDMARFSLDARDDWQWTMMIMQPDDVSEELVGQTLDDVRRKKALPALDEMRLESFREGLAVQIMHIGPYAAEEPTVARLHAYIEESGHLLQGKHHEIYLGDPRRTAPERLRTILRQPMARP